MAEYQYVVDEALCTGHGLCVKTAPELFALDSGGYNSAAGKGWIPLPAQLLEAALNAEANCPESSIRIVSSDD